MAKVPRTRLAEKDLADIWGYIARDNIQAADAFIDKIESAFLTLFETPRMGRSRSKDLLIPGLRSHAFGNYVIFYYLPVDESGGVVIFRVANAARDTKNLLGE